MEKGRRGQIWKIKAGRNTFFSSQQFVEDAVFTAALNGDGASRSSRICSRKHMFAFKDVYDPATSKIVQARAESARRHTHGRTAFFARCAGAYPTPPHPTLVTRVESTN